jgi:hypothetical protein
MKDIVMKVILVVAVAAAGISGTGLVSHFSANSAQVAASPGND